MLSTLRRSVGLAQETAAAAVGISRSHLGRVEQGQRRLRPRQSLLLWSVLLAYHKPAAPAVMPEVIVPLPPISGGSTPAPRVARERLVALANIINAKRL
jgi:transcriptional regulator with XRE-family HTH domain